MALRLVLLAGAGLLASTLTLGCERSQPRCAICQMPVPPESAARVSIDEGPPQIVCDARCPLTLQDQTHQTVALLEVTDYDARTALDPARAFFVTGSDTAPDAHTEALRTAPAEAAYLHWHRCLPSVLAFGTREAAVRFQRQHGGTVSSVDALGFEGRATPAR